MQDLPLLLILAGCSGDPTAGLDPVVADFPEPPRLQDEDPADGSFAGTITAAQTPLDLTGEPVPFLTYNGTVPGPQVRVALGDRVRIHLSNELPDESWGTSIHWHGIAGFNASDGTPTTQGPVEPGQGFDYAFTATRPGIYWYHPHFRGSQALFSGLYGPLVVEDPDEAELIDRGILPADDRVLVLSDTWTSNGIVTSAEVDNPMEIMNGTEGKQLLVNGQMDPALQVVAGSAVRLRLVNTSITRFWRVSVPGHTLYRVGGEGGLLDTVRVEGGSLSGERFDPATGADLGPAEVPLGYDRGEILLAPAERADVVLVTDGEAGEEWSLQWKDFARGRHDMYMDGDDMVTADAADDGSRPEQQVARFQLIEGQETGFQIAEGDPVLQAVGRSVGRVDDTDAIDLFGEDGTSLDEDMGSTQDADGTWQMTMSLMINGQSWMPDMMAGPDQPEAPTARHARLGDTLRWEVRNDSRMVHPYHLHGFSYQPYELVYWPDPEDKAGDGSAVRVPWTYDEVEDTTILPAYASLFFRVVIDDPAGDGSAAGRWMQHCHILQHGENGMMSELVITP